MTDPTTQYTDRLDAADKRVKAIIERFEAQFPTHGRRDRKLTPEEERQDYLLARSTPDGMRLRLREWRQIYGLNRAQQAFRKWDKGFKGD